MGRTAANSELVIALKAKDQASGVVKKAATSINASTKSVVEQNKALVAAANKETIARKSQLSASQKLSFQMRREAATGNKLELQLVDLDEKHAKLTRRMRAMLNAGQKIPRSMIRQTNAAKKQAAALRESSKASTGLTLASGLLGGAIGTALVAGVMRAVRAMTSFIISATAAGDQLQKLSQRTGVGVEAIQEWRFVAESAGVGASSMDNALKKLGKSVGEANFGVKTYTESFEKLGVEIKDEQGNMRDIDDIMMDVADGMSNLTNQSDRIAVAQRLLGRAGADLVNVLQDGSAAIREQRDRQAELGQISAEAAANFEALTQAMTELHARSVRLDSAIGEGLAPKLTKVVDLLGRMADAANDNSEAISAILRPAVNLLTRGLSDLVIVGADVADEVLPGVAESAKKASDEIKKLGSNTFVLVDVKKRQAEQEAKHAEKRAKWAAARKRRDEEERIAAAKKAKAQRVFDEIYEGAAALRAEIDLENFDRHVKISNEEYELDERNFNAIMRNIEKRKTVEADANRARVAAVEKAIASGAAYGETIVNAANSARSAVLAEADALRAAGKITEANTLAATAGAEARKAATKSTLGIILREAKAHAIAAVVGAAESQAWIPGIGPVLAGAAAGTMFALLEGYLAKFEKGGVVRGIVRGGTIGRDTVSVATKDGEGFLTAGQVDMIERFTRSLDGGGGQQGIAGSSATVVIRSDIPPRDVDYKRAAIRLAKEQRRQERRRKMVA